MSLDKVMSAAKEQDFVEFEKALKQELNIRVLQDPYVKRRKEEFDKYKNITNMYKNVSKK
jgi:hypothetical protein